MGAKEVGPGGSAGARTALDIALTQLGVRESAPNRGNAVDTYLAAVGLDPAAGSYPWCAAFVYWCAHEAGLWVPRTASVHAMADRGKAIVVPLGELGDVALHLNADGTGHAGIVMSRATTTYDCVEGNTNAAGSREGDRVAIKTRPAAYWNVFLRPARLGDDLT